MGYFTDQCVRYLDQLFPLQQESEEAAKVYAEIIASFEEPTEYRLGTSSFVKSGTLNPTGNTHASDIYTMDTCMITGYWCIAGEQPAPKSDYARSNQPSASRPTSSISSPPPRPSAHTFTTSSKPPAPKPNYKPMPFVKAGEAALPKSQPKLRKLQNRMQDDEDDDEDDVSNGYQHPLHEYLHGVLGIGNERGKSTKEAKFGYLSPGDQKVCIK